MRLPKLEGKTGSTELNRQFLGYRHVDAPDEGAFYEMENVTSERYPLMAPRSPRARLYTLQNPGGLCAKTALAWTENGKLYYGGEAVADVSEGEKTFVSMGAWLIVFPDGVRYNTADGTVDAIGQKNVTDGTVNFTLCEADGTAYSDYTVSETEPEDTTKYWLCTGSDPHCLKKYSAATKLWNTIPTTYVMIHNSDYSTVYDLDNAWIRMGASDGNRVYIDKSGIQWYGGTATSSGMSQGVIQNGLKTTTEGDTTIFCADTRYQKYGWWHDSSFQGITIEQVDNSVGCSGKLEVNQGIQCRSLSAWDAKNRIVRTDFGNLAINAVESPEPMFCDAGSGECDETGLCYIATEPRYRETVSETQDLRWALTPTGASAALWAEKTAFGAIVHGPAGQCFDWVCWGVQRGFEGVYADVSDAKYPEEENRGAALLDAAETEAAVSLPLTIEEAS